MSELPPFFYCVALPAAGESTELDPGESRHAAGARRLAEGDAVALFDGQGAVAQARVLTPGKGKRAMTVQVDRRYRAAEPAPLVLASALPKGDRLSVMLDMATQLGMTRFIPLRCARSVVKPGAEPPPRWQRICLEACKQSRRAWLPHIDAPRSPQDAVAWMIGGGDGEVWLADADGEPAVTEAVGSRASARMVVIGPEGGFTDAERGACRGHGARPVSLGAGVLRIETAAVAALALAGFRES